MTGLAISKPWTPLTEANIAALPAQLGVFEIADDNETVLLIGYAGGRESFGLQSALNAVMNGEPLGIRGGPTESDDLLAGPQLFRVELTHGYLTRWEELLMVHQAVHGSLPVGNSGHPHKLGRLTVDG